MGARVEKVKPVLEGQNIKSLPPLFSRLGTVEKSGVLPLTFSTLNPVFCRPFPLAFPCPIDGADRTKNRVLFGGLKRLTTPSAGLYSGSAYDFFVQLYIGGQNSSFKIAAYQGVGDGLWAHAEVPIVQQEAVTAVMVGAQAADKFFDPAGLFLIHAGQVSHGRTPACSSFWCHHPPIPPWRRRFSRFSPSSSR